MRRRMERRYSVRITSELEAALEKAARAANRTPAEEIREILRNALLQRRHLDVVELPYSC